MDHEEGVTCMDVFPPTHTLVTGTKDGQLGLWDLDTCYPINTLSGMGSGHLLSHQHFVRYRVRTLAIPSTRCQVGGPDTCYPINMLSGRGSGHLLSCQYIIR